MVVIRFAIASQQHEDKCTNKCSLPASIGENTDLAQQTKTEEFHCSLSFPKLPRNKHSAFSKDPGQRLVLFLESYLQWTISGEGSVPHISGALRQASVYSLSRSLLSVITAEAAGNWERNGTAGCISSESTQSVVQRWKRVLYFVLCCLLLVSLPVLFYVVVLSLLKPSN